MPIFGNKDKSGSLSINIAMNCKLGTLSNGLAVNITQGSDKLIIKPRIGKNDPVEICYTNLTGCELMDEITIIEKSKSVIGRGVVGGLLLGPVGAIVGGMSGIGNKSNSKKDRYLIINYKDESGEIQVASFKVVGATMSPDSFTFALKKKIA